MKSCNVTVNLAMEKPFVIHTPLMWLNKAETWKLADELNALDFVKNETLTCYNGIISDGCGNVLHVSFGKMAMTLIWT